MSLERLATQRRGRGALGLLALGSCIACQELVSVPPGEDLPIPTDTALVEELSPVTYRSAHLVQGDTYYIDRSFTLDDLGQVYQGWLWILTANDDKDVAADSFLTFELSDSAVVAVAYDNRATSLPQWLQLWEEAPRGIGVSDADASPLRVFYRVHPPGLVTLGSNMATGAAGAASMYVPLVLETAALRAASVEVSPSQVTLNPGEVEQFSGEAHNQVGQPMPGTLEWSATGGTITAGGQFTAGATPGTYQVTATEPALGLVGTATVLVRDTATVPVADVVVTPTSVSLVPGETRQLTAVPRDAAGNALMDRVVTWGSNNPGVAAVDAQGLVSAVAEGSATITAISEGESGTASVTVMASTGAPVISDGRPTGVLAGGRRSTVIAVTTDEAATCGLSEASGTPYSQMTPFTNTGTRVHIGLYQDLQDGGTYTLYVRCRDRGGNVNDGDYALSFSVGVLPAADPPGSPRILHGQPSGDLVPGTKRTVIHVATNEEAACGWSNQAGTDYGQMTPFVKPKTVNVGHATPYPGLADGQTHHVYVRCRDVDGNVGRRDFALVFTVGASPLPASEPVRINNVSVATGKSYRVAEQGLFATDLFPEEPRVDQYIDRDRMFRIVTPQLEGMTFIRTANDDKNLFPAVNDFLSFDIDREALVLVAHDDRVTPRPQWLTSAFVDTGLDIYNEKDLSAGFSVFAAIRSPGRVTLGSNIPMEMGAAISMYSVIVTPAANIALLVP